MVKVLNEQLEGQGFNFRPFECQVTTLGKLFTHVPLSPSSINWYWSNGDEALRLGR